MLIILLSNKKTTNKHSAYPDSMDKWGGWWCYHAKAIHIGNESEIVGDDVSGEEDNTSTDLETGDVTLGNSGETDEVGLIDPDGTTLEERIHVPDGFERTAEETSSLGDHF